MKRRERAFTLVELLVVIGIIALLLAILLPALTRAREQAQMVQCMNTCKSMGQAAQMHANDHKGYFPIAGLQWNLYQGQGCTPAGLEDASRRKYTYYNEGGTWRPVPLSVALALYLGHKVPLDDRTSMENYMNKPEYRKLFQCPSHTGIYRGLTQRGEDGWQAPLEWLSYIFNEAFLGRREASKGFTPRANQNEVKQAATVFLFGDGLPRGNVEGGWLTVPEDNNWNWSMYDYYQAHQGDYRNFDLKRHRGRMNVVFIDCHTETVQLPHGLRSVNFTRGLKP